MTLHKFTAFLVPLLLVPSISFAMRVSGGGGTGSGGSGTITTIIGGTGILVLNGTGPVVTINATGISSSATSGIGSIYTSSSLVTQNGISTSTFVKATIFATNGPFNQTIPDQSNSQITVSTAGFYWLGANILVSSSNYTGLSVNPPQLYLEIRVNGSTTGITNQTGAAGGTATFFGIKNLNVNDVVALYVKVGSMTPVNLTVYDASLVVLGGGGGGSGGGGSGTITSVIAGNGLLGGGASGAVTLALDPATTNYIHNQPFEQTGSTASPDFLQVYSSATILGRLSLLNSTSLHKFYTNGSSTIEQIGGISGAANYYLVASTNANEGFLSDPGNAGLQLFSNAVGGTAELFTNTGPIVLGVDGTDAFYSVPGIGHTMIFPVLDGSNGQFLKTNGAGIMSFATVSGGGSSSLAVSSNNVVVSSPTSNINFMPPLIVTLQGSTSAQITLDTSTTSGVLIISSATSNFLTQSSATATYFNKVSPYIASATVTNALLLTGTNNTAAAAPIWGVNAASVSVLSNGLVPNSEIDKSSITASGALVAGTGITLTPSGSQTTIAATGGGTTVVFATGTSCFGTLYTSSGSITQFNVSTTPVKLAIFTSTKEFLNVIPSTITSQITVSTTGAYFVGLNIVSTETGVYNFYYQVRVNGVNTNITGQDTPSMRGPAFGVVNLSSGDVVTAFGNTNSVSQSTITVLDSQLTVFTIGGSGGSSSSGSGGTQSWALAVSSNNVVVSSPTSNINFMYPLAVALQGSTSAQVTIDASSVTFLGPSIQLGSETTGIYVASETVSAAFNLTGTNNVAGAAPIWAINAASVSVLQNGLVANSQIDKSSITAQGVFVAGTNITLTPSGSQTTIAASSSGGSSVYPASTTIITPKGQITSTLTITNLSPGVAHLQAGTSNFATGLVSLSTEVIGRLPNTNQTFFMELDPIRCKLLSPGTTNFPKIDNSTTTSIQSSYWDATSTQTITWSNVLRPYGGGSLFADFTFTGSSITTGNVSWGVFVRCNGPAHQVSTDNMFQSYSLDVSTGGVVPGTAGFPFTLTTTALTLNNSCTEGDLINILVSRNHNVGSDAVGDVRLFPSDIHEN